MLAACSDRPLDKLDPPVLDVLRLGAHQLLNTRVGAHAAVATSVDLAKSVVGPRVSGYVNAVLRRVATRDLPAWLDIVAPDPAADPDGYLATRYSHPRWIVAAYRDALGGAPAASRRAGGRAGGGQRPPPGHPGRVPGGTAPRGGHARRRRAGPLVPVRLHACSPANPAALVDSGAAAVQDEGSQLAAIALSRAPVSPGPRTRHGARALAGHVRGPRRQVPPALRPGRAGSGATPDRRRAPPAPCRPGPGRAAPGPGDRRASRPLEVIVADGTRPPWPDGTFDRVLVDAPCSGLGALRRRPEARWRKSEADLPALTALQRDLLRSALAAVRPGGVVAYVTCSPVPAETSDVVTDVVASAAGVEVLDAPAVLPEVPGLRRGRPAVRPAVAAPPRHRRDLHRPAAPPPPLGRFLGNGLVIGGEACAQADYMRPVGLFG